MGALKSISPSSASSCTLEPPSSSSTTLFSPRKKERKKKLSGSVYKKKNAINDIESIFQTMVIQDDFQKRAERAKRGIRAVSFLRDEISLPIG
tara:strand:+ start:298 stop:576 length:279 start_codon:yes stop_codon:yes gene_type:complete